jgi:UDP-N-acetylmuramyl tripeptide synthase
MSVVFTLLATKSAGALSRLLGKGGGQAMPGLLAERIDPHLAGRLCAGLPKGVILVTGTNGKTTTTKLIAESLALAGERVVTNATGSNLKRGVTSALIEAAKLSGRMDATVGLFEVDEANLRLLAPELKPKHIVVLNLFRDQLDRYGELDTTAALIGQGIAATDARLHLNADDPLVVSLAKYAKYPDLVTFFGIEGLPVNAASGMQSAVDSDRCPICRTRFKYSRVFFSHIGHYRCPQGHFTRPQPSVVITNVEQADIHGSTFTMAIGGRRTLVKYPLPGTYNLYNALAAVSAGSWFGISMADLVKVLQDTQPAFGRFERVDLEGREIYLLLIKNPAGFSQVVETFLISRGASTVLFVINDLAADGRDVSWLWDVPLEHLASRKLRALVSGTRATDMALRLRYAGLEGGLEENLDAAIARFIRQTAPGETAYILPTYTAMLEVRKLLSKLTRMAQV